MIVDPAVLPGLLLAAELAALAAVGYVIVRVALRQDDERMALAQGLVVGPAIWGLVVNFVLYAVPGLAGAAVGWGLTLALGAVLAWRAPERIRPRPRVAAGFAVAAIALLQVALASRQLMGISHPDLHLGLSASIRAGGFPPELPWTSGEPLRYHYGPDLLVGLLAPPAGPDLAFVTELISAFSWASFALVVTTALLGRAPPMAVAIVAPLLLANGLWTWGSPVGSAILHGPIPAGLPGPELRQSLGDVYWPVVELAPNVRITDLLADIHKVSYTMGYALTFVVVEYAARVERWSWRASVTLAALVGFLGLLATTLIPVGLILLAGLALRNIIRARRVGLAMAEARRVAASFVLAGLLLVASGGVFTGFLDGASSSSLALMPSLGTSHLEAFGWFKSQPGGLGLLGLGPLAVAGVAVVLARRDHLVLALSAGAGLLVLAWLALSYPPAPWDVNRFAGHARNLALMALLLALSVRLAGLPSARWRYALAALLLGLITWPTVVAPVRTLGLAVGREVQLANARWVQETFIDPGVPVPLRRFRLPPVSVRIADYIRDHTSLDARVLATEPPHWNVIFSTGRPNNAGFAGRPHQNYYIGPEYLDAHQFLEPAAIRRLGIGFVHATDAWMATLPPRARTWLGDTQFFERLVRDGHEALYRVRPAFLTLDVAPNPASFEALRQAVPPSATAYLVLPPLAIDTLRIASVLSHAQVVGELDPLSLHLRTPAQWRLDSLTDQHPDLIALPTGAFPWMFEPSARTPIWSREEVTVYAPDGAVPPIMDLPTPEDSAADNPPPVQIEISDLTVADGRIEFVATFDERTAQGWTGQDWVVLAGDRSPWAIPTEVFRQGEEPTIAKWYAGLLGAGGATSTHVYRFDARLSELSVRNDTGDFVPLASSAANLGPGGYTLALRLRHEYQPNQWRDAAVIPVLRVRIADSGDAIYEPSADVAVSPGT